MKCNWQIGIRGYGPCEKDADFEQTQYAAPAFPTHVRHLCAEHAGELMLIYERAKIMSAGKVTRIPKLG